jgi:hypothetical protein
MASRRSVVQGLAALAGLAGALEAVRAQAAAPQPLYRIIVDDRFPHSARLADAAFGQGRAPLARIHGDVTDLWFHDLALRWKQGPAPIAGITGPDALFVLERLGWDAGLRVSARALPVRGSPAVAWLMTPVRRA